MMDRVYIANSTISPTSNEIVGWGISVYFETHRAIYSTANEVKLNEIMLFANKAEGGIGGGSSLFYKQSPYMIDRRDRI